jgi:hypothetical protein
MRHHIIGQDFSLECFPISSPFDHRLVGALALLVVGPIVARADEEPRQPTPDKSSYSFFDPVPDDKLREFSTDRPGKSHSSVTVDAGHFQIESDFVNLTYDPRGSSHTTTLAYSIGTPILKYGVTNWMDVQVGLAFFNSLRQSGGGMGAAGSATSSNGPPVDSTLGASLTRAQGFGDTLLGAKINLFGNDNPAGQQLAILPFIKLPTSARGLGNDYVEFTLNAPYTIPLSKPWSLTLEPNFGVIRNADNTRYRENYGFIANLNRPAFVEGLTAAAEIAVDVSSERGDGTKVSFDPSLQYLVTKNLQLDVGIYLGLNRVTPRYIPYVGISARF